MRRSKVGLEEQPARETGTPLQLDEHELFEGRLPLSTVESSGGAKKKKGALKHPAQRPPAGAPPARHARPAAPLVHAAPPVPGDRVPSLRQGGLCMDEDLVNELLDLRDNARLSKNFAVADRLGSLLLSHGIG